MGYAVGGAGAGGQACEGRLAMDNIEIKVEGNWVIVSFDVTPEGELSSTGKTKLIASTRGSVAVDHPARRGLKVSLNATVPVKK
jgi:hypothetical protein